MVYSGMFFVPCRLRSWQQNDNCEVF